MHQVLLQVKRLCSCIEQDLNNELLQLGVTPAINVSTGTIHIKYDPHLIFFAEIIEAIENHDCYVHSIITEPKVDRRENLREVMGRAV